MNDAHTILVVEDDSDVRDMLVRHLTHHGYQVIVAADGMEGLQKVDAGGYDLVITDIVMPFVSGVGIVTTVKTRSPETPVIAITGYGKEPEALAVESKADLVLGKPVSMADLTARVREFLEGAHGG